MEKRSETHYELLDAWCRTLADIWKDDQEGINSSRMYGYSNMEDAIYYTEGKVREICREMGLSPEERLEMIFG